MSSQPPKIAPLGSGTFDSWGNYRLQESGVDVYQFHRKLNEIMSSNDSDCVYLGHSILSREVFQKMSNIPVNVEVKSCIVDYPYKIGDYFPDTYKIGPQQPLLPNHYKDYTQPSYGISVGVGGLSKWRTYTFTNELSLSLDLPGVEINTLSITVENDVIKVGYQRVDEGAQKWETHYVNGKEYDLKAATATFKTCILNIRIPRITKPKPETIKIPVIEK